MLPASTRLWIAGARKAVIKLIPAAFTVSLIRASVIMPVSDQHDVRNPETLLHLLDLSRQRRGIANIAFENLDRHRTSLCRAHKAEHDLNLVALAIAIVAAFGQRAGATVKIGRGNVVKNEG